MNKTRVSSNSTEGGALRYLTRVLHYLLPVIGVVYVIFYIYVAISRMGYPYELEWMEGRALEHVQRLLAGQSIYPVPTLEFIPLTYTPLFFYISYFVALLTGGNFFALRLVSFLSSLGIFAILFLFIKRETSSGYFALLAVGYFAATYGLSGYWFDIARVDSLFICLLLGGIYFIRFGESYSAMLWAALLVSLAFFTKQTALLYIIPLAIYLLFVNWKRFLVFFASLGLIILGVSILLDNIYNHWYNLYTVILPYTLSKYMVLSKLKLYLYRCLLMNFPFVIVVSCYYLITRLIKRRASDFFFYFCLIAGLQVGALPLFFNIGGYYNDLMAGHLALTMLFVVGLFTAIDKYINVNNNKGKILVFIIYILSIIQFCIPIYNPFTIIPTNNDKIAGDELVKRIAAFKGDVLIPSHPYLAARAGKGFYIHTSALDVYLILTGKHTNYAWRPDPGVYKTFNRLYSLHDKKPNLDLSGELMQDIENRKFGAIILDSEKFPLDLKPYYKYAGTVFDDDVFWTYTGVYTRPNLLYLPTMGTGEK
jgi:hypothetical protein